MIEAFKKFLGKFKSFELLKECMNNKVANKNVHKRISLRNKTVFDLLSSLCKDLFAKNLICRRKKPTKLHKEMLSIPFY